MAEYLQLFLEATQPRARAYTTYYCPTNSTNAIANAVCEEWLGLMQQHFGKPDEPAALMQHFGKPDKRRPALGPVGALKSDDAADSTAVFSSGIGGFPCVRVPSLLQVPAHGGRPATLLAFAECRSMTGDGCEPAKIKPLSSDMRDRTVKPNACSRLREVVRKRSAHALIGPQVCMRASTSAGATWGPLAPNISAGRAMYPTAVWEPSTERVIVQFNNWPGAHGCLHLTLFWLGCVCSRRRCRRRALLLARAASDLQQRRRGQCVHHSASSLVGSLTTQRGDTAAQRGARRSRCCLKASGESSSARAVGWCSAAAECSSPATTTRFRRIQ